MGLESCLSGTVRVELGEGEWDPGGQRGDHASTAIGEGWVRVGQVVGETRVFLEGETGGPGKRMGEGACAGSGLDWDEGVQWRDLGGQDVGKKSPWKPQASKVVGRALRGF